MKWIFIMLLAANLIYLGWELDRQEAINQTQGNEALIIPPHAKKLVLLKELPSPPAPRTAQEDKTEDKIAAGNNAPGEDAARAGGPPATDVMIEEKFAQELVAQLPDISVNEHADNPEAPATMCFSFGPFPDDQQGKDLKAWFEERNIFVQQRPEKNKENQLFWIYLAPQDSLGGAMHAIEDLKKKGIKDYRLIETGDLRHAISLGLFSTQASVNKRLNELKGKGYQPIVVPYREANVIYWIDVKLANQNNVLNQMFLDYPSRYNSVPVACSEIAIARETP
jgi:hypothetical protein